MNRLSLSGKTAVLTGASRGIGLEISRAFAQQGVHIIGIARSQSQLDSWQASVELYGVQAVGIAFDLNETARIPELSRQIDQRAKNMASGRVDILINNAGIEIYRAFQDYGLDEIERVVRVNLLAAMALTRLLLPQMNGEGHVVNMASLASKKGHPFDSAYAASKAGLLMWNHSLRQELAGSQIGVSAICPGYVVDQGMLADTGVEAPFLAGRSHSQTVAKAVLNAVLHRRREVIVNQNWGIEAVTRLLLALEQIFPVLADLSNDWLGITQSNRQKANQSTACKEVPLPAPVKQPTPLTSL